MKNFEKQRILKYFLSIWVWVLSIEYILNNQTQMLEFLSTHVWSRLQISDWILDPPKHTPLLQKNPPLQSKGPLQLWPPFCTHIRPSWHRHPPAQRPPYSSPPRPPSKSTFPPSCPSPCSDPNGSCKCGAASATFYNL